MWGLRRWFVLDRYGAGEFCPLLSALPFDYECYRGIPSTWCMVEYDIYDVPIVQVPPRADRLALDELNEILDRELEAGGAPSYYAIDVATRFA